MALLTSRASLLWKPVLRSAAASLFGLQNRRPFFVFANDRDVFLDTPPGAFLPAADAFAFFFDFNGVCIRPEQEEAEREYVQAETAAAAPSPRVGPAPNSLNT